MKIGDRVRYSEAGLRKSPAGPGMSARQYAETLRGTVTDLDYYKGDRARGILHVLWDGNSRDTRVSVSDVESVSRANPRKKAAKKNPSRKGMVKVKSYYRHVPGGAAKAARAAKSNPREPKPRFQRGDLVMVSGWAPSPIPGYVWNSFYDELGGWKHQIKFDDPSYGTKWNSAHALKRARKRSR